MSSNISSNTQTAVLRVSDLGGINTAEVVFKPGLTALAGVNATNRTSVLLALNEVLGGTLGSVRRAAEGEAHVELAINGGTYTRTLIEHNQAITRNGTPYTDDSTVVNLYASLVKRNRIRRTVASGDSDRIDARLANLLMAPIDVNAIQAEIEERREHKQSIERQLDEVETAKEELPELISRRKDQQEKVEALSEEVTAKRKKLASVDEQKAAKGDPLFDELRDAQEEYQDLKTEIQRQEQVIETVEDTLATKRDELADVEADIKAIDPPDSEEIEEIAEQKRKASTAIDLLTNLTRTSQSLVAENRAVLPDGLRVDGDVVTASVTDSNDIDCPLCGTQVARDELHSQRGELQAIISEYQRKREQLEEKRTDLQSQRNEWEQLKEARSDLEREIWQLEERLEDSKQRIDTLEADRETKHAHLNDLRDRIEEAKEQRDHNIRQLYDDVAALQEEQAKAKAELERLEDAVSEHEATIGDEEELREARATVEKEIQERRERITSLEERAREAVSSHMDELVERLDYDRIDGLHIERRPTEEQHLLSEFELVISRRREDGVVMEERDIGTLSESERSLVGLVVALAGHVAHRVGDEVPFLLLDAIEQFDAERIDRLISYVREELDVDYIVAALLPEDAEALSSEHTKITPDDFE